MLAVAHDMLHVLFSRLHRYYRTIFVQILIYPDSTKKNTNTEWLICGAVWVGGTGTSHETEPGHV